MKTLLPALLFIGLLTSCTSEYEERFEEGLALVDRIETLKESQTELSDAMINEEMAEINNQIITLAKLSGHEKLFLTDLKGL